MLVEFLGGIHYSSKLQLHTIAKQVVRVSAVDRTRYGRASASPRSFMQHHCQRLSSAAVMWDATAICKKIGALKQHACLISHVSPSIAPTVA
jgi:hypothetical protein